MRASDGDEQRCSYEQRCSNASTKSVYPRTSPCFLLAKGVKGCLCSLSKLRVPSLFGRNKIDAAEALSGRRGGGAGGGGEGGGRSVGNGGGVEPRLADFHDGDGAHGSQQGVLNQHPSSTVVRDSQARAGQATGGRLGPDAAASLLQSRFRDYRIRKGGAAGGGGDGVDGVGEGGGGGEGGGDRGGENGPITGEAATSVAEGAGDSGRKCSLLDLEVGSVLCNAMCEERNE